MYAKSIQLAAFVGLFFAAWITSAQEASKGAIDASSTTAPSTPVSLPSKGKALIYVYRDGSAIGAANHPVIFVNDELFASLHKSNYASREVQPGTVVFSFLSKSTVDISLEQWLANNLSKKRAEALRIDVEGGKTYFFKWSYASFTGAHPLKLVDVRKGEKEIGKLHLARD